MSCTCLKVLPPWQWFNSAPEREVLLFAAVLVDHLIFFLSIANRLPITPIECTHTPEGRKGSSTDKANYKQKAVKEREVWPTGRANSRQFILCEWQTLHRCRGWYNNHRRQPGHQQENKDLHHQIIETLHSVKPTPYLPFSDLMRMVYKTTSCQLFSALDHRKHKVGFLCTDWYKLSILQSNISIKVVWNSGSAHEGHN